MKNLMINLLNVKTILIIIINNNNNNNNNKILIVCINYAFIYVILEGIIVLKNLVAHDQEIISNIKKILLNI